MYGSATASVTDRPLDIFVDGDNGDDVNIGTIPDAPLATLAEAERRIPDVIEHTSLIVGTLGWGVEMLGDNSWLQVLVHVDVDATGGEGYICADDTKLEIIQGDITADICIVSRRGGRVLISDNLTCNITTADTRVEDPGIGNTDQAIGGYGSVGSYIAAGDGSKIQRET